MMLHFQPELIDLLPAAVAFTIVGLTMLCCGRTAPKPQKHYDDKVEDLIASGSIKGFASVAKATTGNQFAYHKAKGAKRTGGRVDLSAFNTVVHIDDEARLVQVEGLATMETVVRALDWRGYRIPIVPELKHITVGGAIAGIGIESGSFRYGWFHQAMVECDLLTPGGEILRCSASNEHADVFHALPNSYGTLGYVLRATLRLVVSRPYVAVTTTIHKSFKEAMAKMEKAESTSEFVEGLWWAPDKVSVTLTNYIDEVPKGKKLKRFDGLSIYYKAVGKPGTMYMTSPNYYFRWDADWFWNIPTDAGGWLVRLLTPRKLRTSSTYKWLRSLRLVKAWHRLETLWKPQGQPFVQDWAVPWSRADEFVREATKTRPHRKGVPYMLLPVGTSSNKATHYPCEREERYLNLGTYTEIDVPFEDALAETRRIDDLCVRRHAGIKMLYSSSFLDLQTYTRVYGTLAPATKKKVDPEGTRPSVFEKTAHPSILGCEELVLGY